VGDIAHELEAPAFRGLERAGHVVERGREFREFARIIDRDTFCVVTPSDPTSGRRKSADGSSDPGGHREAHHRCGDDRDHGRGKEGLAHRVGEGGLRRPAHRLAHRVAGHVAHRFGEVPGAHEKDRHADGTDGRGDDDKEGHQEAHSERPRHHQDASRSR